MRIGFLSPLPPESEDRPDGKLLNSALALLKRDLHQASTAKQAKHGRSSARRLTKLELKYTLKDLLQIDSDVTSGIPDETEAGSFDTVGANQRISAVHSPVAATNTESTSRRKKGRRSATCSFPCSTSSESKQKSLGRAPVQ